jgi:hypothetical protein
MKSALTCLGLSALVLFTSSVDAAYVSRGGYTIASHRSGGSYSRSSIRYMTGRGPRLSRYIVGAGHYTTSRNAIIDTYTRGGVSYLGQWAGGPRGSVVTNRSRRNENFVFIYANGQQHATVDNIDIQ